MNAIIQAICPDATDLEIAFAAQADVSNVLSFITETRDGIDINDRVILCAEWSAVVWEHANALHRNKSEAPFWESQVKNHWDRLTLVNRYFLAKFGYADVSGNPSAYAVSAGRRF